MSQPIKPFMVIPVKYTKSNAETLPVLTEQQHFVVKSLSEGKTVKEIALDLKLSPKTVEFHSLSARNKIGVYDIARLTRWALKAGITALSLVVFVLPVQAGWLGNTNDGTSTDYICTAPDCYIQFFRFYASSNLTASTVHVKFASSVPATFALYTGSVNYPSNFLGASAQAPATNGWAQAALATNTVLSASNYYWIAFSASGAGSSNTYYYYSATTGGRVAWTASSVSYTNWPTTVVPTVTTAAFLACAYVEGSDAASPPVVGFSASPTNGEAPLTVTFTNTTTGATNYLWDFGNGTSTNVNPSNTYTNASTNTVTLTAIGAGGTNSLTLTNYIVVTNALPADPPVAGFSGGPVYGFVPMTVNFTNTTTGATNYLWDYGDGITSTETNPTHTYTFESVWMHLTVYSNGYYQVYTNNGNLSVTLTAVGPGGTNTLVRSNYLWAGFVQVLPRRTSSLTFQWDHSPDTNVIGYVLYQGNASHYYTNFVDVGYTNSYRMTGLPCNATNYFAVTAYVQYMPANETNSGRLESDYSEECANYWTCLDRAREYRIILRTH